MDALYRGLASAGRDLPNAGSDSVLLQPQLGLRRSGRRVAARAARRAQAAEASRQAPEAAAGSCLVQVERRSLHGLRLAEPVRLATLPACAACASEGEHEAAGAATGKGRCPRRPGFALVSRMAMGVSPMRRPGAHAVLSAGG